MAVQRTILADTPEYTTWREEDATVGYVGHGTDWKTGTPQSNADALRDKATAALAANATYLALPSPTNAQNLAQIRALTREANALVRLLLGSLDSLDGT